MSAALALAVDLEPVTPEQIPGLRRALSVLRAAREEYPRYSFQWEVYLECCRRIAVLIDEPEVETL